MLILVKLYGKMQMYINRINGIITPVGPSGFDKSAVLCAAFGSGNKAFAAMRSIKNLVIWEEINYEN